MNRRIRAQQSTHASQAKHTSAPASSHALSLRAMRAADVLGVQTVAGNRAARTALQRSMEVGAAGDSHEVEADAVAREIVAAGPAQRAAEEEELQASHLQRQEAPEEEGEELQMKRLDRVAEEEEALQAKHVQRAGLEEEELQAKHVQRAAEEEELQMKRLDRAADEDELQMSRLDRDAAPEVGMDGGSVSAETSGMVESARGGGSALAPDVRREMEGHFGADFSGVRVHQGAEASDLNSRLSARAFTTGSDIFVGQGGLNAGSRGGKELLAHELTHVVQQGAAPAAPARKFRRKA
ncbi:MAG: DUF4157 domain-containing protein [Dehalococcoidia bacterium]|nr:DUF4157 domain-containing protein [Dehalococcoidia bacterium]